MGRRTTPTRCSPTGDGRAKASLSSDARPAACCTEYNPAVSHPLECRRKAPLARPAAIPSSTCGGAHGALPGLPEVAPCGLDGLLPDKRLAARRGAA